jgi:pimeloyl-ACP methyl ester carboxylesterase
MTHKYFFLLAVLCVITGLALLGSCSPAVEEEAPVEPKAQAEPVSELRDGFFDSGGVRIHFVEQGQGDPVVMLHGFSGSYRDFVDFGIFESLVDEGYRAIAVDCRGYGQSDKPHDPDAYGIEMVEDIVRLLDHLHIEKAHVMGGSMGGAITNKLRETHPERLLTAVLGLAGWMEEGETSSLDMNAIADSLEKGEGLGMLLRALTPEGEEEPSEEEIAEYERARFAHQDPKALAAVARSFGSFTVSETDLRQNTVPTLAIIGEKDPLKKGVDAMEGVMSNLEIVIIEGANHVTAVGNPIFLESLLNFLEKHRQTPKEAT